MFKLFSHTLKICRLTRQSWLEGDSSDTILKGDNLRTIPSKFGPDWLSSFREEDF